MPQPHYEDFVHRMHRLIASTYIFSFAATRGELFSRLETRRFGILSNRSVFFLTLIKARHRVAPIFEGIRVGAPRCLTRCFICSIH
jgi:hypothetical protein